MILEVFSGTDRNVNSHPDNSFCCYRLREGREEKVCVLYDKIQGNELMFEHNYSSGLIEKTYFSLFSSLSKELKKGMSFSQKISSYFILDVNNNCIGKITHKIYKLKNHKLTNFTTIIFQYKNVEYEIFKVGFRQEGQYYIVYENDINVAIIDILHYRVYSIDDRYELLHIIMYHYLNEVYGKVEPPSTYATLWTPYQEIRDKFNPEFIKQVKMAEGMMDLKESYYD